jgi:hypothetical protein
MVIATDGWALLVITEMVSPIFDSDLDMGRLCREFG